MGALVPELAGLGAEARRALRRQHPARINRAHPGRSRLGALKVRRCDIGRDSYRWSRGSTGSASPTRPGRARHRELQAHLRRLRKELAGVDAWLLVLDTRASTCGARRARARSARRSCAPNPLGGLYRIASTGRSSSPSSARGVAAHEVRAPPGSGSSTVPCVPRTAGVSRGGMKRPRRCGASPSTRANGWSSGPRAHRLEAPGARSWRPSARGAHMFAVTFSLGSDGRLRGRFSARTPLSPGCSPAAS